MRSWYEKLLKAHKKDTGRGGKKIIKCKTDRANGGADCSCFDFVIFQKF